MPRKFWQNRNVFVTGCTGLLGSWLTEELVRRGANVVGLVRDLVPRDRLNWSGTVNRINVVRGPVEDYALLERTLNEYEVETVFHLAAQPIVRLSYKDPVETFTSNVMGTINVLEAARETDSVQAIVNITSDKCYENRECSRGYRETDPMGGYDPYSASKGCAELVTTVLDVVHNEIDIAIVDLQVCEISSFRPRLSLRLRRLLGRRRRRGGRLGRGRRRGGNRRRGGCGYDRPVA